MSRSFKQIFPLLDTSCIYLFVHMFINSYRISWKVLRSWFAVPGPSNPDCLSEKISPSDTKWLLWTTNCFLTWLASKSENCSYLIKYCIVRKVVDGTAVYLRKALLYSTHIALESILVWNGDGRWGFFWGSTIAVGVSTGNIECNLGRYRYRSDPVSIEKTFLQLVALHTFTWQVQLPKLWSKGTFTLMFRAFKWV